MCMMPCDVSWTGVPFKAYSCFNTQCSWDKLRIQLDPDQDNVCTEDEYKSYWNKYHSIHLFSVLLENFTHEGEYAKSDATLLLVMSLKSELEPL